LPLPGLQRLVPEPDPSVGALRTSWLTIRSPFLQRVLRIQAGLSRFIREFLDSKGFVEVLPPIIGPVTDPGIRGAKQATVDFYGREYRVMSSAILYKQMVASSLGKMYFFSPNVRLESPETVNTGRHLVEFVQVDLEVAHATYHEMMGLCEELLVHVVARAKEEFDECLKEMGRELKTPSKPFKRLTYRDALDLLAQHGHKIEPTTEIPWEEERLISELHGEPFFIHDYPKGARGFYDREDPERPGILRDFDLIYPGGYGEAASGAEREFEYAKVVARIRNQGEDLSKYGWYLEMLRYGVPPTAGFGIGLERLTRFICGQASQPLWLFRPYPKVAAVYSP